MLSRLFNPYSSNNSLISNEVIIEKNYRISLKSLKILLFSRKVFYYLFFKGKLCIHLSSFWVTPNWEIFDLYHKGEIRTRRIQLRGLEQDWLNPRRRNIWRKYLISEKLPLLKGRKAVALRLDSFLAVNPWIVATTSIQDRMCIQYSNSLSPSCRLHTTQNTCIHIYTQKKLIYQSIGIKTSLPFNHFSKIAYVIQ